MKHLFDSNVWVSLTFANHPHHEPAARFFEDCVKPGSVAFCQATRLSFLRLITTPKLAAGFGCQPFTNRDALGCLDAFLADDRVFYESEQPHAERDWRRYASKAKAAPSIWMDAYLAAFAKAAGYAMVTFDSGYSNFAGLDLKLLES